MTSAIQLFNYGEHPVRTVKQDNEVWFVAKDICDILGLDNITEALRSLEECELSSAILKSGSQGRNMRLVNESGVYALTFKSRTTFAREFRYWVTSVVLPQVLRNGLPEKPQEKISMDFMNASKMVHEAAGIKDNQLALALDKIVEQLTGYSPLALSGTALVAPNKCQILNATELGKHFGISARKLNSILCANGYQKREGKGYEPLEAGEPYAVMLDTGKTHSDGTPVRQLKWESSFITEIEDLFTQEVLS